MSKIIRRASLTSGVLLLCSAASCYLGERRWASEMRQLEEGMRAAGFHMTHVEPGPNPWHLAGLFLLVASLIIALVAFLVRRQENRDTAWPHQH